jgi:flagellar basal-body rod modification protein FlgD
VAKTKFTQAREEGKAGREMATAALGIWNHIAAAGQNLTQPAPAVNSTNAASTSSSGSSDSSATISANDFLTLLVTEMQNQDPTADTDPNEYINQLVQVNSLEQLISINQTLTTDSSATTPSGNTAETPANPAAQGLKATASASSPSGTVSSALHASPVLHAPGNLSIPLQNPAAARVAQSLGGRAKVE